MSLDAAMREVVDEAVRAAVRVERDRLARILRDHGYARVARDVECCDDEGAGPDECPECEGSGGSVIPVPGAAVIVCPACSGSGYRAPRVTA